jgi:hypothetical protein
VAGAAAVAQEVDVELELLAGRGEREHRVVLLLEGSAGAQESQARSHARDVRIDRDVAQAVGEEQHAGGGLAPHAGQGAEVGAAFGHGRLAHPRK